MKNHYATLFKSKIIFLFLFLSLINLNGYSQCSNGTLYPTATFIPANNATNQVINTNAFAGEYCNVSLLAGKTYRFSTSVATDFITLRTSTGSLIGSSDSGILNYFSPTAQVIRYYIHLSSSCNTSQVDRTRFINVGICSSLSNLSISNITANSFQINFVGGTAQNRYLVTNSNNYSPNSISFDASSTNSTEAIINNYYPGFGNTGLALNPGTLYYVWVGVQCANGLIDWLPRLSFLTLNTFGSSGIIGCNAAVYGCHPQATFTPAYTGQNETIATDSWVGEFCKVNIIPNTNYTFSTSNSSDYITITSESGLTYLGSGYSPYILNSATSSGVVRYYLTTGPYSCTEGQNTNRIRYIKGPQLQNCPAPTNVVATMTGFTTANVTWSSSIVPNSGFDYILSQDFITPTASSIPTGNVSTTNVILNNLIYDTYYVYVRSNCGTFKSNWITVYLPTAFVPKPANLTATNITSNGARLKYNLIGLTNPSTSIPIKFYVSTSPTPPIATTPPTFSFIYGTLGTDGMYYEQIGPLNSNTTYYYWMRTSWDNLQSDYLAGGSFTTNGFLNCNTSALGIRPEETYTPLCNGLVSSILANSNFLGTFTNVTISPNTTYTFSSSSPNDFITITNNLGTSVISSGTTPVVWSSGNNSGVFRYFVHGNSSCGNSTDTSNRAKYIKCQSSLSNDDFALQTSKIFPNPTKGLITISNESVIDKVVLLNIVGQIIRTETFKSNKFEIDMSDFESGAYFVKVYKDNAIKTIKVIKE